MTVCISRRTFLKRAACLSTVVGVLPGDLLLSACSGDSAGIQSDPRGYLFPLEKGPLRNNGATPWYATLFFGTPGQKITVMMDTGTANTWSTSALCTTEACAAKAYKYDTAVSSTHQEVPGATWQHNDLGAWGEFESLAAMDDVRFNDPTRGEFDLRMKFLAAILKDASGSTNWRDLDMCGGVGFPVIFDSPTNPDNPESLLPLLFRQGRISDCLVSFWSEGDNGGCIIGGTDPSKYNADTVNRIPLSSVADKINLWTVELAQVEKDSTPLLVGPLHLALDSGSSRFKGSPSIIEYLIDRITTTSDGKKLPTTFSDPALVQEFPSLAFEINHHKYCLHPEDYIWKIKDNGLFSLQFHPLDIGDDNTILAGSVFLDQVYSAFQYTPDPATPYGMRGGCVCLYEKP